MLSELRGRVDEIKITFKNGGYNSFVYPRRPWDPFSQSTGVLVITAADRRPASVWLTPDITASRIFPSWRIIFILFIGHRRAYLINNAEAWWGDGAAFEDPTYRVPGVD